MGLKESGLRGSLRNVSVGIDAIPDSAVLRYDPSQLSLTDGDNVATRTDQISAINADGSATFKSNIYNGENAVRYDGSSDTHTVPASEFSTISQPYTVILAIPEAAQRSERETIVGRESSSDNSASVRWDGGNSNSWQLNGGSVMTAGSTQAPLILSAIFDGANSAIRENQTETTGDAGTESIESLSIGSLDGSLRYADFDSGEVIYYNGDLRETNDISNEEQRLAEKYDIPL